MQHCLSRPPVVCEKNYFIVQSQLQHNYLSYFPLVYDSTITTLLCIPAYRMSTTKHLPPLLSQDEANNSLLILFHVNTIPVHLSICHILKLSLITRSLNESKTKRQEKQTKSYLGLLIISANCGQSCIFLPVTKFQQELIA